MTKTRKIKIKNKKYPSPVNAQHAYKSRGKK